MIAVPQTIFGSQGPPGARAAITLVLGGARSGKSRLAESLAAERSPRGLTYIATATVQDAEMRARVDAHRADRPKHWTTVECPLDLPQCMRDHGGRPDHALLVDCLTLWLTNLLLAGRDIDDALDALEAALKDVHAPVVMVSNEVGLGIVPETSLGRRFRDIAGVANQRIARQADMVLFVAAGLPMPLKVPPSGSESGV